MSDARERTALPTIGVSVVVFRYFCAESECSFCERGADFWCRREGIRFSQIFALFDKRGSTKEQRFVSHSSIYVTSSVGPVYRRQ